MKLIQIVIILLITGEEIFSQNEISEFLDQYFSAHQDYISMSYDVEISKKYFSSDNAMTHTARVLLSKSSTDTVFSGFLSIDFDSLWYGYDGTFIYRGDKKESVLSRAVATEYPGVHIQSTWVNDYIENGFLTHYLGVRDAIEKNQQYLITTDALIDGNQYKKFVFRFPDNVEFSNEQLLILIDKSNYTLKNRSHVTTFQENQQITNWNFSNITFSKSELALHEIAERLKDFEHLEEYMDNTNEFSSETFQAEIIQGVLLNSDEAVSILDDTTNFKILDFWYSSCYPCIKSIPIINRIANTYISQPIKVYGINLIDDAEKQTPRLLKYQKNNPMSYPTIMIDKSVRNQFPQIAYPTFVILNKNGNVIFMESGFSEDMYHTIKTILDDLLSKN